MLGGQNACWEIAMHAGKVECMLGGINACWEGVMHAGKAKCMLVRNAD